MTKEKIIKLNKYVSSLKDRLTSAVPSKHVGFETEYKQWLTREIKAVADKLEVVKLEGKDGK